jgi:hypothetical protein
LWYQLHCRFNHHGRRYRTLNKTYQGLKRQGWI